MAKIRVLSVDGGGVKGIIPATILAYLENKLIEKTGNSKIRISDFFDFAAGTSTGAIITAMAITPKEKDKPPRKMDEVVQLYFELAGEVFKKDWKRNIKTCWGLFGTKYSESTLDSILLEKLDHWKLNELKLPCAFTGYDTHKRKPVIYTNRDDKEKYGNYYIKDVVRGSTSIPAVFKPAYFRDGVDINTIIDGGVFANNPAMIAYVEMLKTLEITKKFKKVTPEHVMMLSFGTGTGKLKIYPYNKIKKWGVVRWFIPVLNILLQGMSEVTNYQMEKFFSFWEAEDNFVRINPVIRIGNANAEDASEKNMKNLHQDAINYISENHDYLDELICRLIKEDLKYSSVLF